MEQSINPSGSFSFLKTCVFFTFVVCRVLLMATQFIGYHVSINCGANYGFFQGTISTVDAHNQTITIDNPYKNGVKCNESQVTIRAKDITDLTLLDELMKDPPNKPVPKASLTKVANVVAASGEGTNEQFSVVACHKFNSKKSVKSQENLSSQISSPKVPHSFREQRHPLSKDGKSQVYGISRQKIDSTYQPDDCFSIDHSELSTDFDFEKNLALFDKQALYANFCSLKNHVLGLL